MSSDLNLEHVFTKVSYKRKGKTKNKTSKQINCKLLNHPEDMPLNPESSLRRINDAKEELLNTGLYQSVLALFKEGLNYLDNPKVIRIVCFGLGTISEFTVPRYQLALLLCLRDLLQVEAEAFDPVFNNSDICLLEHFNIRIQKDNNEGKYYVSEQHATLFFLPHCPKQLLNNLIWSNWGLNLTAGLYYLAELVEEYTTYAKKIIWWMNITITFLYVFLWLFESFPDMMIICGVLAQICHFQMLSNFPCVAFSSPIFLFAVIFVVINHYLAFSYFSSKYHPFSEVIAYFTLFLWLVPFALFVSLSANDNVLPTTADRSDIDVVSNYLSKRSKKSGLITLFTYAKESLLPIRTKKGF